MFADGPHRFRRDKRIVTQYADFQAGESYTLSSHLHCTGNLVERDIRIEDVLDLGEKFNDVLFVSRNNANLVERSTVNTNDILVLGEKINDSLIVSE